MNAPLLSHVSGDRTTPLIERSIGGLLLEQAGNFDEREFLVDVQHGKRRTWREFTREAEAVACGFVRHGYQPGDRLGVWLPNCHEWIVTQFACHLSGLVLVNINPAYRAGELRHALNLVECKGVVTLPRLKTSDHVAILDEACSAAGGVPSLRHIFSVEGVGDEGGADVRFAVATSSFSELLASEPSATERTALAQLVASLSPTEMANIQFTSGTTGAPKAATLTHRSILNNARFMGAALNYSREDRVCVPVPLYHCFGCVVGSLACVVHGATLVLPSAMFEPDRALQAVEDERCTSLYGVPTMFSAMLALAPKSNLGPQLRTGVMGGSPCPPDVMAAVMSELGMRDVTVCYGMTETSPTSFQTTAGTPVSLRCETVGTIHPHAECKIIGEDSHTLPRGEVGELCTRGYLLFDGYYNQPEATAEAIDADGWMRTGDLASIDADGYCRIVGRKKDMIIRGGENIYPAEVENFLRTHPDVSDVAVVGAPQARLGEEVVAFVTLAPRASASKEHSAEGLREWCKGRIAHYKVPARVILIDELPLTVSGKVQKFELKKRLAEEEARATIQLRSNET
jgi:fatty-acyl-CoA synthase